MTNKFLIRSQSGQVIVVLLLLMLVALSIGLAVTQKSVTDVTTSTQTEQSSRAFSAAEAGIEKALSGPLPIGTVIPLDNNSKAEIAQSGLLPYAGSSAAIEYPKIGRETTAQFWFVDPFSTTPPPPASFYTNSKVDLYYGNEATSDKPAVEVSIVMLSNGKFYTKNYYYDSDSFRATANGNTFVASTCNNPPPVNTILGSSRKFFCKQTIPSDLTNIPDLGSPTVRNCPNTDPPYNCTLILARLRFLYINENHSLALAPVGVGVKFPPQVQIYNATGTAGQSKKQIQAFRVKDVVLPWFDFAVFSVNELRK